MQRSGALPGSKTAAGVMVDPSIATNSTTCLVGIDPGYASTTYGNLHAYQQALTLTVRRLRRVEMVISIDRIALKQVIKRAVQYPPTCADLS